MLHKEREYARMEGGLVCPKCYNYWEPDCPNEPWWVGYRCIVCGYAEGCTTEGDNKIVIDEGKPELQCDE